MRNGTKAASWVGVALTSVAAHVVAFGYLGHGAWGGEGRVAAVRARKPTLVEMTVSPPRARPPSPAPSVVPQAPRPRLVPARLAARVRMAAPVPAPTAQPPPAAETVADFTGQTLTNDGPQATWSSATGNGQPMNGPVGRPGARLGRSSVEGSAGGSGDGAGDGPLVVGLGDLSRTPAAPDLSDALAAAYPADARARGLAGQAVVKARITPEGGVRDLAIVRESRRGFGAACVTTLRGSTWTAPLDRDGHAVSTVIHYTCRFTVAP